MMRNDLPSVSLVLEWENARLSELGRSRRMLSTLAAQLAPLLPEMPAPPEMIVLHDEEAIDPALITRLVEEAFGPTNPMALRLVPTTESQYYRQKNRGAEMANGEVVLFLDSDVVPDPGWLEALLGSFRDPSVEVVCGNTYIDPEGLYGKSFALFWFFPLRSESEELAESGHFFANNVAFRRELFLAYRFPEMPTMRGQCLALADALRRDGHRILINRRARVSHPPPNGLSHFVRRAICEGHDNFHRQRGDAAAPGTTRRFWRCSRDAVARIRHNRHAVGLGAAGAVPAVGIAVSYHALAAVGEVLGRVSPDLVRRHLAV